MHQIFDQHLISSIGIIIDIINKHHYNIVAALRERAGIMGGPDDHEAWFILGGETFDFQALLQDMTRDSSKDVPPFAVLSPLHVPRVQIVLMIELIGVLFKTSPGTRACH